MLLLFFSVVYKKANMKSASSVRSEKLPYHFHGIPYRDDLELFL